MSRLISDDETIKIFKSIKPGDPRAFFNMEAIAELPDDIEAIPVKVKFDPSIDFTNLGSDGKPSMYPSTKLMYKISEERGISIIGEMLVESLYEEVNISEMEMATTPVTMKKKVGYVVKKTGSVLQDDGTPRVAGHIGIFNAWDECSKLWSSEERWTEGYSKDPGKWPDGKKKENKYDTKWKRRLHFQEMLDNALGNADTKAWLKCIRDLAGLPTGFTKEQIKDGVFFFIKLRRSEMVRKAETAARLSAISRGGAIEDRKPQSLLFGNQEPEPVVTPIDDFGFGTPEKQCQQSETKRELLIKTLSLYRENGLITEPFEKLVEKMIKWAQANIDAETRPLWEESIKNLKVLESTIPQEGRLEHGLY